jgi:hypothetical protein
MNPELRPNNINEGFNNQSCPHQGIKAVQNTTMTGD